MCKIRPRLLLLTAALTFFLVYPVSAVCQPIPSFQMQLSNGKNFSFKDVSKEKPLILIYFAPECEHCQVLMDAFFKRISEVKNCQVVLVTFKPINEVADFEKQYKTHNYPNIKVGSEVPIFFFRKYYQLQSTPFTALYDKNGNMVISYKKDTPVEDLLKHYKSLNQVF